MIVDIENVVFNDIYLACISAKVIKGNAKTAPSFPCVTVDERLNTTNDATFDSSGEYANDITYEINIFSNSESPVAECKVIRSQIDGVMSGTYGMRRTFSDEVPNYEDTSIYRYLIRYQAVVDKNKTIYRR